MTKRVSRLFALVAFSLAASIGAADDAIDVMCVYYPHWHEYPKGNEWFHKGFTEWEFVETAKPRVPGQKIPFRPLYGYLDGKNPADVAKEIDLASNAGIDVFLFDWYWYGGEMTMQESLEQGFLRAPNRMKMKFCLMWCYHDRVDSFRDDPHAPKRMLMALPRTPDDFLANIRYSKKFFHEPNHYMRDGKPFFSIYNAPRFVQDMGGPEKTRQILDEARAIAVADGLNGIFFQGMNPWHEEHARILSDAGFDCIGSYNLAGGPAADASAKAGTFTYDYAETIPWHIDRWKLYSGIATVPYIPAVTAGRDTTMRCRESEPFPWTVQRYPYSPICLGNTPDRFQAMLEAAKRHVKADPKKPGAILIYGWNEYTEGGYIAPNNFDADGALRAVAAVFGRKPADEYTFVNPSDKTVHTVPAATFENVAYGRHSKQKVDVWIPKGKQGPFPTVVYFHSGDWSGGAMVDAILDSALRPLLDRGVAVVAVGYRYLRDAKADGARPPVMGCLDDCENALGFVKDHAAEWNVDASRIGLAGGSAGACTALYLALKDDCAHGVKAVAPIIAQTSMDPKEMREWISDIRYGAHAFGYRDFDEWLGHRAECLEDVERISPAALLRKATPARVPAIRFLYSSPLAPGERAKDPTHSPAFGERFREIAGERGIKCEVGYGGRNYYGDAFDWLADFLLGIGGKQDCHGATRIEAGVEWRPVEMGDHECVPNQPVRIPELEIVPGTALDLSAIHPRHDIDANGRVIADAEGRLVFENAPESPVRLRGFNCTYGGSWDMFQKASKDEIAALAEQIRLMGFNLLRLHFFDAKFVGLSGRNWWQYRDTLADDAMPQTKAEIDAIADLDFLDRFHWFVKCLRDRGVYLLFDVITPPNMMMTRARKAEIKPRVNLFFSDKYRRHWKAAFDFWTQTVNPYTGTRFLDDPQVIGLTFCNEQDFVTFDKNDLSFFTSAFREEYGEDMPEFRADLLWSTGAVSEKARAFLRARIREMTDFYIGVAKERGFKGLLTHWDMLKTPLGADARRSLSAIAMHTYHAHPKKVPLPEGVENERRIEPWNKGTCTEVPRGTSLTDDGRSYLARTATARVLGKPFLLTEYSHIPGNECVQEAPVVQSAVAALQDWQALLPHANVAQLWHYDPFPFFDEGLNLMARVASVAMAFGWQRGDIGRAHHAVSFTIPENMLASPDLVPSLNRAYVDLAFVTRIGSDIVDKRDPVASLNIVPLHAKDAVKDISQANDVLDGKVQTRAEKGNLLGEIVVKRLRSAGILSSENKTDPSRGFFESETGEIRTDLRNAYMTVDAPRFQAAALKPGQTAKMSQLSVESVSTPASIMAISLDSDKSVHGADRVLLIVATQFMQDGAVVMQDGKRNLFIDEGPSYRQLMRAGRFRFSIATNAKDAPKVYALRMNGTRAFGVPAELRDGRLLFDMDMSSFEYATPFFEVVNDSAEAALFAADIRSKAR